MLDFWISHIAGIVSPLAGGDPRWSVSSMWVLPTPLLPTTTHLIVRSRRMVVSRPPFVGEDSARRCEEPRSWVGVILYLAFEIPSSCGQSPSPPVKWPEGCPRRGKQTEGAFFLASLPLALLPLGLRESLSQSELDALLHNTRSSQGRNLDARRIRGRWRLVGNTRKRWGCSLGARRRTRRRRGATPPRPHRRHPIITRQQATTTSSPRCSH